MKLITIPLKIVLRLGIFLFGAWCTAVVFYSPILPIQFRLPATIGVGLIFFAAVLSLKRFWIPATLCAAAVIVGWTSLIPQSNRNWREDLAQLPWSEQNGDEVTIHNVRDFIYRSENDFTPRYTTKKVRLSEISSLDIFTSYWAGKDIAHVFVTFGFADKEYISFSIEVRKSKEQEYSSVAGFFRNYELIYVVGEERDIVALRTKYRQPNEEVHMLRLAFSERYGVELFQKYLKNMNALTKTPEFYNTLTTNCTTQVLALAQDELNPFTYNWKILLSGHTPEYLESIGSLAPGVPLSELMEKGHVNSRAQDVSDALRFSQSIREGVPKPAMFN